MPQVIVGALRQTPCLPCPHSGGQAGPAASRPPVAPQVCVLRMSSNVSSLTELNRCAHRAKMSLLGALLLALVGAAIATTPTVLEQNTHNALAHEAALEQHTATSLASKSAAQVKSANALQSTTCCSTPGQLSSGETLLQVNPPCTYDQQCDLVAHSAWGL